MFDAPLELEVFYLDVVKDVVAWRDVLIEAERWLGTSSDRARVLDEQAGLHDNIKALVPWQVARIQIARSPAARRMPVNIPGRVTHRACVLWYADDTKSLMC